MIKKHSFVATNPCHVYDLACHLNGLGYLSCYYSGYPEWKLSPPAGFPLKEVTARTLVTYGLQQLPEKFRPADDKVFRWQDRGFDLSVSKLLKPSAYLHGIPGQCMSSFQRAGELGTIRILNHASGPILQQRKLVKDEYERVGLNLEQEIQLPNSWLDRLEEETALADIHLVASELVKSQLIRDGLPAEKILVIPYGANQQIFSKRKELPEGVFKICFAGRQSIRKGIHYLLKALEMVDSHNWESHFFGMKSAESRKDFADYSGSAKLFQHGTVSQTELGKAFREMSVLVLPSVEEAFGLVVVQALNCGVPCIVSDRVGAKDLIRHRKNGSIVPFGDISALAAEINWWSNNRINVMDTYPWESVAEKLIESTEKLEERNSNG